MDRLFRGDFPKQGCDSLGYTGCTQERSSGKKERRDDAEGKDDIHE